MTSKIEVRFTAKRAAIWNHTGWKTIGAEKARFLIATGQAVDVTETDWL